MKIQASSVNQVKDHNTSLILNALKDMPSGTKSTVSQVTGLSIATCNTILNELAQTNKVLEIAGDSPSAGRPPKAYQFNADYSHVCCMYFTHENWHRVIHYAIVNLLGETIEIHDIEKEQISSEVVLDTIGSLIAQDPLITKISMGFSGFLEHGRITSSGIPELWGCPLGQLVKERFGTDTHINNDMNTIALGLFKEMCPDSLDPFCAIGLFKGRCPGAGTIINSKIVKGFTNYAGEVLHLNADSEAFWSDITPHYNEAVLKTVLIISSFITIVNPRTIILTGINASGQMIPDVIAECKKSISPEHIPEIKYIEDIKPYYINGLFRKTAEE